MRKWMLCLLALAAMSVSVNAQSPEKGLKTGYIVRPAFSVARGFVGAQLATLPSAGRLIRECGAG